MINKVILIGNLGKAPELRTLESGNAFCKFSLATNESYKDKSGEWQTITEWHNIILWGASAERADRQLQRGSMVYVEGKLTNRSYQDSDGNTKYITEVRATTYRLLEKAPANNEESELADAVQQETSSAPVDQGMSDDLPF